MNQLVKGLFLIALPFLLAVSNARSETLKLALEDELQRSMEELRAGMEATPYFISYTVHTDHSIAATAAFGGMLGSSEAQTRSLQVEMRVGSPEFDNTNFISTRSRNIRIRRALPLEEDYDLIRKQVWLATDIAYKSAIGLYTAKEAALKNTDQEKLRDFSAEEPNVYVDMRKSQKINPGAVRRTVVALSKLDDPSIQISSHEIEAFANQHTDTYVNSEGSYFERIDDTAYIRATAWTQTSDGRYLTDYAQLIGRSWDEIANRREAKKQIGSMYERLMSAKQAEPLDRYVGPVLIQGQAAGELIGQVLAPNLLNLKRPIFENIDLAGGFNRQIMQNRLQERVGARVLPRGLNIYDDPTVQTYQNERLIGHYPVDSDGLPTRRVQLVENGTLKTLLSDRNPSEAVQQSTASNATSSGPSVSNLFIEPMEGVRQSELQEKLIELVLGYGNEYGLRIDHALTPMIHPRGVPSLYRMGRAGNVFPAAQAYKVYPDGTEELVRNVVVATDLLGELRNLPAYSETTSLHHGTYMFRSGDISVLSASFPVFVSISTPDLLFEDLTITYPQAVYRTTPIVPHPSEH